MPFRTSSYTPPDAIAKRDESLFGSDVHGGEYKDRCPLCASIHTVSIGTEMLSPTEPLRQYPNAHSCSNCGAIFQPETKNKQSYLISRSADPFGKRNA